MDNQLNFHTHRPGFAACSDPLCSLEYWWLVKGCWNQWAWPCPVLYFWAPLLHTAPHRAGGDILGRWLKVLPASEGKDNLPSSASLSAVPDSTSVSLCHGAGFSCCYHIIYSFARSSEAFALFFSNVIMGIF